MIGMNGIDLMIDVNNDVLVYASFFLSHLLGQPEFGKDIISESIIPVTSHHVTNLT